MIADVHATEEPGYWTFRSRPNPVCAPGHRAGSLQAATLLVGPQLLRADHAGVEEAGLVERVALLSLVLLLVELGLLHLVRVVDGLLAGVVALVGVGVGLLVPVGVLLLGLGVTLLLVAVRVLLLGGLLVVVGRLRGVVLLLGLERGGRDRGVRDGREVGEVVGVAGVLDLVAVVVEERAPRSSLAIRPCSFCRPFPTASRVLARTASKAPSLTSTYASASRRRVSGSWLRSGASSSS